MIKVYNTQEKITSEIQNILEQSDPNIRKTQLKFIPYIIFGILNAESSVAGDIAKMLKDDFSLIQYDSITRRIRRLYRNKYFDPYYFYENVIKYVLAQFKLKHADNVIHIVFDHMYSHDNYTVLLFSKKKKKTCEFPFYFNASKGIKNQTHLLIKLFVTVSKL